MSSTIRKVIPSDQAVTSVPIKKPSGYIPSLDGWRAIAILGVLWTHDLRWIIAGHKISLIQDMGGLGVNLFFAISGILITTRILEEERLRGYFDIKKFYIRRIFRIQPAAWIYLVVIACLLATGCFNILWRHWFGALGMYENFLYQGAALDYKGFFVGHFWSLAVEEHFYILLSLFLLFVKRNRLALLTTILMSLYFLHLMALGNGAWTDATARRTYYQLPGLVYGACFALALRKQRFRLWAKRNLKPWIAFCSTAGAIVAIVLVAHRLWPKPDDFYLRSWLSSFYLLNNFIFAYWVASTTLHANSLTTKTLECIPLRWIGKISYSLYLWHVLFFSRVSPNIKLTLPLLSFLSGRPYKYIAAFAMASLSYYLIEKPCMRIGHRLAPPATPGRPELVDRLAS